MTAKPFRTLPAFALALAAVFFIFCTPDEDSQHWFADLVLSKTAGCIFLTSSLRMLGIRFQSLAGFFRDSIRSI